MYLNIEELYLRLHCLIAFRYCTLWINVSMEYIVFLCKDENIELNGNVEGEKYGNMDKTRTEIYMKCSVYV